MPSRVIREGIIDSEAVNSLDLDAEVFYRRLMSIVDDYGRFEARPELIRARLFWLQPDLWSVERVQKCLTDVSQARSRVSQSPSNDRQMQDCNLPLVTIYEVGGKKYLQINNFQQRTRTPSKYPAPSEDDLYCICQTNDGQMTDTCPPSRAQGRTKSESETKSESKAESESVESVLRFPRQSKSRGAKWDPQPGMRKFFADYPGEVKPDWDTQIYLSVVETPEDEALILRNTAAWKLTDKWQRGFIPTCENYLKKRQWRDPPSPGMIIEKPKEFPKVLI